MKKLRKIIALFIFIFLAGIFITVFTINTSLNKGTPKKETVEFKKDSIISLTSKKEFV